ncbi:MAG: helix-turn-helix domain-containing protein [Mucilaginibacter sp.]|uniref:helix-turn-helix domain-containing protein n=1 Tax=Mucilaginibacter sp. TaxID=1882438 RepID=UPI003262F4F4
MQHIGKNIKAIREKQGSSLEDLARRLKIRKKTLATIEQMSNHTEVAIKRTAEALGLTVDDIINCKQRS